MPELPEVETVMRGLAPVMKGEVISKAHVNRADLRWPFPKKMADRLTGKRILALRRRSKYILIDVSSGETLLVHLGMSGRMLISGDPLYHFLHTHPVPEKHDHVVFDMANGTRVTFNDPRRFGTMDLMQTATCETHKLLAKIGPEPFSNQFHESYLCAALSGRKAAIKSALLDQKTIAGLGNIYACEVLFRSGISPLRTTASLSQQSVARLVPVIRKVLQEAIESGGSSLRDFRQADGELGYFQHSFAVYGREGESCRTESCAATITRIVQSGRSSFYCRNCQK